MAAQAAGTAAGAPAGAVRVWVCRHARSVGNELRVMQGWEDHPLSPAGAEQAADAARFFTTKPVDLVVSSPLLRARSTAELLFGRVDTIDTAWCEQATVPGLAGGGVEEAHRRAPHLIEPDGWSRPDGPLAPEQEHLLQVRRRAEAALLGLGVGELGGRPQGEVAVVTHGAVLAALLLPAGRLHAAGAGTPPARAATAEEGAAGQGGRSPEPAMVRPGNLAVLEILVEGGVWHVAGQHDPLAA